MHRATASLTEIPLSATPSKPKKPRFSVISTMTPTISSKNISTKKIMPFDPIPAENSITNSPQIYAKSEQNTPMKLYILNSGLFKTKRVYDFSICSQLKEMSSSINFPCIKEAPVVSQFPEDDSLVSEACDSSRSLPIKSPSYNETQAKITSPLLCRICLDHENAEDFIFPCRCNGSQKYVHQTCLKLWLLHSTREEMELTTCELCKCPLKMFFHYSTKCNPCADGKSNLA